MSKTDKEMPKNNDVKGLKKNIHKNFNTIFRVLIRTLFFFISFALLKKAKREKFCKLSTANNVTGVNIFERNNLHSKGDLKKYLFNTLITN